MPSLFSLAGKVSVVTGANRGIGYGMARALAEAGSDIVLWGRDAARNRSAAAALGDLPVRVLVRDIDVGDEQAVVAGMCDAHERFGRIDAVFANAGVTGSPEFPWEATADNYDAVFRVNVAAVLWTLREGAKAMMARTDPADRGGSLVAVSSLAATLGAPMSAPYCGSKAAVEGIIRSLAVDYGPYGIRANAVAPGFVRTDMQATIDPAIMDQLYVPRIPLGRIADPVELGGVAVFLASRASSYQTGTTTLIDGGYGIN